MKKKRAVLVGSLALLVAGLPARGSEVLKASGAVSLEDSAGDVEPMSSSSGEHPGRDVVKLDLASDGTNLTVSATLASEVSGTFANDVVQVFVDTDNDPSTGGKATFGEKAGFESQIDLLVCIEYENGGEACVGGAGEKATAYSAAAKITDTSSGKALHSVWDLPRTPIQGKVVSSSVSYQDLGIASGQTIRLFARESNGAYDPSSYFPEVALTLK
jgi:hypothetical protein